MDDAPDFPPPVLCWKPLQGGSTGLDSLPDSYLHATAVVAPDSLCSDESLDDEGYLKPDKLN
jgi:hypothetical protein